MTFCCILLKCLCPAYKKRFFEFSSNLPSSLSLLAFLLGTAPFPIPHPTNPGMTNVDELDLNDEEHELQTLPRDEEGMGNNNIKLGKLITQNDSLKCPSHSHTEQSKTLYPVPNWTFKNSCWILMFSETKNRHSESATLDNYKINVIIEIEL